jgi:hypothetical protein
MKLNAAAEMLPTQVCPLLEYPPFCSIPDQVKDIPETKVKKLEHQLNVITEPLLVLHYNLTQVPKENMLV